MSHARIARRPGAASNAAGGTRLVAPLPIRLLWPVLAALLLSLLGCGGGGFSLGGPEAGRPAAWPGHGFEGAVSSGPFSLVAVNDDESSIDSRSTAALRLDVQPRGAGRYRVDILSQGLAQTDRAFLHLKYDSTSMHPAASVLEPSLRDSTIFLGLSDYPGIVALGMVGMRGEKTLGGDSLLASVEFEPGAPDVVRRTSSVTGGLVKDLRFDTVDTDTLVWSLANTGDYNQSGQVSITDLTPIGIYFQARSTDNNWSEARVADGDDNGIVAVQDLTPIGLNFLDRCDSYDVQTGPDESGPYSSVGTADLDSATTPAGGGFKEFRFQLGAPVNSNWYVVYAVDESTNQTASGHSNAVQYSSSSFAAPQNLAASSDGSKITLTWDAPAGPAPDGYQAYVSDSAAMAGAQQMNVGPIGATTFDCPLAVGVDSVHFFGVKAVYGSDLSGYSNIFNYSPVGAPPSDLIAAKNGNIITLSWTAPGSGTPEGYNAYIDDVNADMSAAQKINLGAIAGTSFDCPLAVSPDSSHYFAVKAIFAGEETGYSNIYFYEPGNPNDTDPPAWDNAGQEGIKSAVAGDTLVDIEWYTASDSGSPPVSYQIYYAPTASGIDWGSAPQETSPAGTTQKQITGLTNDTSYDFGVRAVDNSGNATTNTNFLSATPVGGGVPVDSGIWQTPELVDDGGILPSQQLGYNASIEVAPDGSIGIAHYNFSSGDLVYTYGSAGSWTSETVSAEGDTGLWPDLKFDPITDEPCIAYHNASAFSCEFARKTGGVWAVEVVDDSSGDNGSFASLAFDPDDNLPAIAYWRADAFDTKFAKFNGTSWVKSVAYNGTGGTLQLTGSQISLAYNPGTGEPAISFIRTYDDGGFPQAACWYTEYSGSSWSPEEADIGPLFDLDIGTAGFTTSLVFDDNDDPWIVHLDFGQNEVRISERTQGFWQSDMADTVSGVLDLKQQTDAVWAADGIHWIAFDKNANSVLYGVGYAAGAVIESGSKGGCPTLAQSANTDWHAAYMDYGNNTLRYAKKVGANPWAPETAMDGAGSEGVVGDVASLKIYNYPRISYYDASNSALKFADRQPGSWRNETVSNEGFDGSASGLALTTLGINQIAHFSLASDGSGGALYLDEGGFGSWGQTVVQSFDTTLGGDVVGNYCTIANSGSPDDLPGIAYSNSSQKRCEFALGDGGGSFEQTTIDTFNDPGRWTSVAFNPANDFPGVAYFARDTQDLLFAERDGVGLWTPTPVDTLQDVGNHCSAIYGSNTGRPWISYYDSTNDRLKVAYLDTDDSWKTIIIAAPGGSTDYGIWSSVAWHPLHNRAAVAFYDSDNGKLWYVFIGDPDAPQAAVEVDGPAGIKVGASCSLYFNPVNMQPSIAYQDVTNGDLYYVERLAN